jgi:hypothetical protein
MKYRVLSTILVCSAMPMVFLAKEHFSIMSPQHQNLTPDQAISAVRSKAPKSGTSFQIIREIQSSAKTQEVAQRSLQEAASRHVSLYGDGIFLNILKGGGFLILETDATTGNALSLHLISSATDGRPIIESHEVEGNVSSAQATELVGKTADFVDASLSTPPSAAGVLETRFYGGRFPEYDRSNEQKLFRDSRWNPENKGQSK